jgi:hypothetical protein
MGIWRETPEIEAVRCLGKKDISQMKGKSVFLRFGYG